MASFLESDRLPLGWHYLGVLDGDSCYAGRALGSPAELAMIYLLVSDCRPAWMQITPDQPDNASLVLKWFLRKDVLFQGRQN